MLSPCTQVLFPLNPDISAHFIEFSQSWQPIRSLYVTPRSSDSKTSTHSRAPRFWFLFSLIRGNQGRIYGMSIVLWPSVIYMCKSYSLNLVAIIIFIAIISWAARHCAKHFKYPLHSLVTIVAKSKDPGMELLGSMLALLTSWVRMALAWASCLLLYIK